MNTTTLLPDPDRFCLEHIACTADTMTITITSGQTTACCPLCSHLSNRIHSRYRRTLADLPWNRVAVRLHLQVYKFYCDNPYCQRAIFTEPIPELAARY